MSRQSKNAKRKAKAKEITALHLKGEKGPAKTTPKHEKRADRRLYTSRRRGPLDQTK